MKCDKCGSIMADTGNLRTESYLCVFCGNVHYPAYPKREVAGNICEACGEEFDKKNVLQKYCPECRQHRGKVHPRFLQGGNKNQMEAYR